MIDASSIKVERSTRRVVTEVASVDLDEEQVNAILLAHFGMPNAHVAWDISSQGLLRGVTVRQEVVTDEFEPAQFPISIADMQKLSAIAGGGAFPTVPMFIRDEAAIEWLQNFPPIGTPMLAMVQRSKMTPPQLLFIWIGDGHSYSSAETIEKAVIECNWLRDRHRLSPLSPDHKGLA